MPYSERVKPAIALLVLVLLSGCAGSVDSTTTTTAATSTSVAPETTASAPTTTTAPTIAVAPTTPTVPTTTTSRGPYEVGVPEFYPLSALPGSDGASGSGCSPGAGALPDGVWFGYVLAKSAADIDFDLSCFYFGDIAYTKGAEDGEEVNNDYYVRNINPTLRAIPVAPAAAVWEIETGSVGFLNVPFSGWPVDPAGYIACPSDWCGVWLFVNGGDVTEILEQFVP